MLTLCIGRKKNILLKHIEKLIDTLTLIGTDKNTTLYFTNVWIHKDKLNQNHIISKII